MSTERDVTRIVRSWLRTEENDSADRVLGVVLDRLDTTPQRRIPRWPAWRTPDMNLFVRIGFIAAAVALVAVLGYGYLRGGSNLGGPGPTIEPTPQPTVLTTADVGRTLSPGTYRAEGPFAMPFIFTIESAWILEYLETDVVSLNRAEDPGADWLDFELIENVYADPCAGELHEPPVAKTPADLVGALEAMPGFDPGPITETSVGGYSGRHLVVTNDIDGDAEGCIFGNGLPIYTHVELEDPAISNGGARDEFWVVDVDGTPVMIHSLITRTTDEAADVRETERIIETVTFD